MPEVRYAILSSLKDGDVEGLRDFAGRATAMVKEKDPGTTIYNWMVSEDGSMVINEDGFDSTESLLAHLANMAEAGYIDEFMARVEVQAVRVLGEVDDAAREALAAFGAQHYSVISAL